MANPKVKPEGKKIAEKVMDFIDMNSSEPIFKYYAVDTTIV